MKILLFGGTSEGRELARWLEEAGIPAVLCVATEYGASLVPDGRYVRVLTGRLDRAGMDALLKGEGFTAVVDATHPYAVEVTGNLREAAEAAGTPYRRLLRDGAPEGDWLHAADMAQAARLALTLPGHILLTTGSKEAAAFAVPGLAERTHPRVLPSEASLRRCLELGFPPAHVLCMQGPFSRELNEALIRQYGIRVLVTKASGGAGGFWEKAEAAEACGCALIVIDRPLREEGADLEEIKAYLKGETA